MQIVFKMNVFYYNLLLKKKQKELYKETSIGEIYLQFFSLLFIIKN